MNSKKCSVCGLEKCLSDYQVRKASRDGFTSACKDCLKIRDKHRYPKERERRAELMRLYMQTEQGKEAHRKASKKWREFNSLHRAVNIIFNNALRDGKVHRNPCFVCGKTAQAHHPDYDRPLDVIWLCPKHHKEAHQLVKE